jgi:hypothetical protein
MITRLFDEASARLPENQRSIDGRWNHTGFVQTDFEVTHGIYG